MGQQSESWWTKFLDSTALDWIGIILSEAKFPENQRPTGSRQAEIESKMAHLSDEPLDTVVSHMDKLLDDDERRLSTIESKAFTLIGITGIASGFVMGFAQLLLTNTSFSDFFRYVIGVLYVLIGASLLVTLILARRAIVIGKYKFMSPDPLDILKLTETNRTPILRERAVSMLFSYEHNRALINDKATYVRGAQDWFRNVVFLLFVLLIVLVIYLPLKPLVDVRPPSTPMPVIIVTVTSTPSSTRITQPVTPLSPIPLLASPSSVSPIATQMP